MAISEHHAKCYASFQELCKVAKTPINLPSSDIFDVQNEFDRYKLWAGNVGAPFSGPKRQHSLDHRLRESPFYRDQTMKLLALLNRHAQKVLHLLNNPPGTSEDYSVDPLLESESALSSNSHINAVSNDTDTSSWQISSDSMSDSEASSPDEFHTKEIKHEWLPSCNTPFNPSSPLESTLWSIRETVSHLCKLPIRKPAPMSRLKNQSNDEVLHYEFFDIAYVKDKLPRLDPEVAVRLGKMITKRRQLLIYRKRHQGNLQVGLHSSEPLNASERKLEISHKASGTQVGSKNGSTIKAPSDGKISKTSDRSKATTFRQEDLVSVPEERDLLQNDTKSYAPTSVIASEYTRNTTIEVPPRPLNKSGNGPLNPPFEGRYCSLVQTITSDREWKHHVLADLQPYVCTFLECNLADHFFENRDAWFSHETQKHRLEFFCNTPNHESFWDKKEFIRHMELKHDIKFSSKHFDVLQTMFQRPSRASGGICNLCLYESTNLKRHISRHLQQLSTFATLRSDYVTEDGSLKNDSNAAQDAGDSSIERHSSDLISLREDSTRLIEESIEESYKELFEGPFEEPFEEPLEEVTVPPDAEDRSWDFVTAKFMEAREGHSELPPIKPSTFQIFVDEKSHTTDEGDHQQVIEQLPKAGTNLNAQGKEYHSLALYEASKEGHNHRVEQLLKWGADVNAKGGYYNTALQVASRGGHQQVVEELLKAGADVNMQGDGEYLTALQVASKEGHQQVVDQLLNAGADVNAQGGYYNTALYAASKEGHSQVVKQLLNAGADIHLEGAYFSTPLQAASRGGHEQVVEQLLKAGADVNNQGGYFNTAIQAASRVGYEQVVKQLIEAGADVNMQDRFNSTALLEASRGGHQHVVKQLLNAGADVTAQDFWRHTALQIAETKGHKDIAVMLRNAEADRKRLAWGLSRRTSSGF